MHYNHCITIYFLSFRNTIQNMRYEPYLEGLQTNLDQSYYSCAI